MSTFKVDEGECNMVHCQVKLTQLQTTATGAYTCEVSSEAPKFRTATETRNMTVAGIYLLYYIVYRYTNLQRITPIQQRLIN